ncbi:helix-turn-helix domain-containing protein [Moraxella catarrhalis]|nr:helix-turn-helix domain-containing protein [Moraxella catarrhalis]
MSQKNLASLLSIRAETLSRTLRSLINQQIISVNGVQYTILKSEHLEQMVEQ